MKTYAQVRSPSIVDKAEVARQLQLLADPDSTVYVVDSEELEIYEDAAALLSKGNDGSELQTFASNIRFNAVKHAFDKKLDNFKDFSADSFEIFVRARNWNKAQLVSKQKLFQFISLHFYDVNTLTGFRLHHISKKQTLGTWTIHFGR